MSEIINKYQKGVIYTIRSFKTDKYYIGSTTSPLYKRLYQHKQDYKRNKKGIFGKVSSCEILEFDDAYIELLENYPCNSKMELERREGELIRLYKNDCVNKCILGRTIEEWKEDNKEHLKKYEDKRKLDPERIKYKNEFRKIKIKCECGVEILKCRKSIHIKTDKHIKAIKRI
jgi:hypothetical protein